MSEEEAELLASHKIAATTSYGGSSRQPAVEELASWFRGQSLVVIHNATTMQLGFGAFLVQEFAKHDVRACRFAIPDSEDGSGLSDYVARLDEDMEKVLAAIYRNVAAQEQQEKEHEREAEYEGELVPLASPSQLADPPDMDPERGWVPFPTDDLPLTLRDYIRAAADAVQVDEAYVALPVLTTCAAAIGNSRIVRLHEGWHEPSILWSMLIADPSSRKSPAADQAAAPVWEIEKELAIEHADQCKRHQHAEAVWNARNSAREADNQAEGGEGKPQAPERQRLIVGDSTVETVIQYLAANPHGLYMLRDELSGLLGAFGRYAKGGGGSSEVAFYLESFRGRTYTYDRKSGLKTSLVIPRNSISIYGTIQPQVLARTFTQSYFENGLAARFLLAMPPTVRATWKPFVWPGTVRQDYHQLIRSLFFSLRHRTTDAAVEPKAIPFSESGMDAWAGFYERSEQQQHDSEGETRSAISKLEGYVARFSLLLATVDTLSGHHEEDTIEADHVIRAAGLRDWFLKEAERVYSMIHTPETLRKHTQLLEFIKRRGGEITPRQLVQSNAAKWLNVETAKAALQGLVDTEKGKWDERTPEGGRGRPSLVFVLSPNDQTVLQKQRKRVS